MIMFIYQIKNNITGKCYVGQTTKDINIRFKEHSINRKSYIGRSILKYGIKGYFYKYL